MFFRFLAPLITLFSTAAAHGSLEFSAYLTAESQQLFVLTDHTTGRSSGWLTIGESFSGYTLSGFEAKTETLIVKKTDQSFALPLKLGKIQEVTETEAKRSYWVARTLCDLGELLEKRGRLDEARSAYQLLLDKQLPFGMAIARARLQQLSVPAAKRGQSEPNKAPEPTPGSVTPRAIQ